MRVTLCFLLAVVCVLANKNDDRRSKLPFIADALGNTLPPPSNVPATVGSPVNLITPDRYEFYTFDESGELVKRLMTLEEIQAIVAAGEEAEGLVTLANDNQPTSAFNFSQPPYTKVHSVVTNVQNVLKAQMEAHKNKPHIQPTLDTPDVSDSWSLILPSIFGNTGVDIVPDKSSGSFTTPETETIMLDNTDDNSLSKEGSNQIVSSSTGITEATTISQVTEKLPVSNDVKKGSSTSTSTTTVLPSTTTTSTTTTTRKPTNLVAIIKSSTTTSKPTLTPKTTTTRKPTIPTTKATTSTSIPVKTTESIRTSTTLSSKLSTKSEPRTTSTTTTESAPTTLQDNIVNFPTKLTTSKPKQTTSSRVTSTKKNTESFSQITLTTERNEIQYEKISTFIPISKATYVTERTSQMSIDTTKPTLSLTTKPYLTTTDFNLSTKLPSKLSVTTYKPPISTIVSVPSTAIQELDKINSTTITTQSVSPSTTVSSTEFIFVDKVKPNTIAEDIKPSSNNDELPFNENDSEPILPLFDVAQSISQIATDLGGNNYQPIPTTSNLLDSSKLIGLELESKENTEMDIPTGGDNEIKTSNVTDKSSDNFVKISTLDPQKHAKENTTDTKDVKNDSFNNESETQINEESTTSSSGTTIDSMLSESMDDLLSQVVNQNLQAPADTQNNSYNANDKIMSENNLTLSSIKIQTSSENSKTSIVESTTKMYKNPIKPLNKNNNNVNNTQSEVKPSINKPQKTSQTHNNFSSNTTKKSNETITETPSSTEIHLLTTKTKPSNIVNKTITENLMKNGVEYQEKKNKTVQPQVINNSYQNKRIQNTNSSNNISNKNQSISKTQTPPTHADLNNYNIKVLEETKFNMNEKQNNSAMLPKIDEFKKKIQKVNIDDKELANERNNSWKLISTVTPPKANEIPKDKNKIQDRYHDNNNKDIVLDFSQENQGLEVTTKDLGNDVVQFTELCNELAFRYWHALVQNIDKKRSFVLSPYSITSMLAMMFMGARGGTSEEMNEVLKLDDMVTFNPHFTLKNISDSIETNSDSGIKISAFIRELYSDRNKGKILTFYKERAQHFYNGHVEEINFKIISDIIRRRTNLLVKRYTWGRITEYMKENTITMEPPLAAFSANIFQTDCTGSSVEGRDGEMYFVVSPNVRQRRLVPVPAVVYRHGFLAGYDPVLDATAAALGNTNSIVSTLFLMPGQQGNVVHADDLEALEKRLLDSQPTTLTWNRLLRTLLPRIGLELQIPRFLHKSIFNISSTLRTMGLNDLFEADHADLGGLNGPSKDLYLSDMIQLTSFVTCGEGVVGEQHHIEEYPDTLTTNQRRRTSRWAHDWDEPRDYQRAFHDPHDLGDAMHLPLHLRPRQARLPSRNAQPARLKFDRPFLYFVRHNPSGMILYVGRYNPRLLP